jgi:hypothetical protein
MSSSDNKVSAGVVPSFSIDDAKRLDAQKIHAEVNQLRYLQLLLCSFALALVGALASTFYTSVGVAVAVVVVVFGIYVWHAVLVDVQSRLTIYLDESGLSEWERHYLSFKKKAREDGKVKDLEGMQEAAWWAVFTQGACCDPGRWLISNLAFLAHFLVDRFRGGEYGGQRRAASKILSLAACAPWAIHQSRVVLDGKSPGVEDWSWNVLCGVTAVLAGIIYLDGKHVPSARLQWYRDLWREVLRPSGVKSGVPASGRGVDG